MNLSEMQSSEDMAGSTLTFTSPEQMEEIKEVFGPNKNECISCGHILTKVRHYPAICGMCNKFDPRAQAPTDRITAFKEDHYKTNPPWGGKL